jgi:hypothetical protein
MRCYAVRPRASPGRGDVGAAITWSEPARETAVPRGRVLSLLHVDETLCCVWSGRWLDEATLRP